MKTIKFLTLVILFCVTNMVKAQFVGGETVYVYKYDHTETDGIKSKSGEKYMWVNFQKDMMGKITDSNISYIRNKLVEDPSYYSNKAIQNLANSYNEYRTNPAFVGSYGRTVTLIKYCSDLTTSSKTTYREMGAYAQSNIMQGIAWWSQLSWKSRCYSFSNDKSELIVWDTTNSDKRDYYVRIKESELKLNTDFLY